MALPSDYISGTITLTNGSTAFTGAGTGWLAADFREGDIILDVEGGEGAVAVIASITSNTAGVLSKEWEGPTLTGVAYRMRYQWDSGRVSAQSRAAIEMLGNGNLQSFASLTGPGVPVFDGPHSVTVKPESDFVNGVAYDVQVDTLADRDAYDGQSEGFAVLVSDVGDGRSALYSKKSNTVGDWGAPAYITGPVGPLPDVEATVGMLPPGSTATVTPTPITGGVRLDFELPEARGFYSAGVYDDGEEYNQDDVVRHNGSSFIALQPVPVGEEPSGVYPPVDTAYWQVLAAKGQDGTGTGDVVGPSGSTDGRLAAADGTTGKTIKYLTPDQATAAINVMVGDSGSGGSKGLVPAPASGDAAANKFLRADGTWSNVPESDTLSISLLALALSEATSNYVYIGKIVADAYKNLGLVNVVGATNLDTSEAGYLKPTVSYSADLTTTGFSIASGEASTDPSHDKGNAFDNGSASWLSDLQGSAVSGVSWIGQDFGAGNAKTVRRVTILQTYANGLVTNAWVEYSDNGTAWTVAASVSGMTVNVTTTVDFASVGAHRYWRLRAATGPAASNYWWVNEIQMMEITGYASLTVASEILPSAAEPEYIAAVLRVVPTDALTLNTDLMVDVSRDGSTWAQVVLEAVSTAGGVSIIKSQACDVSGQPSGNTPRYRIRSANGKNFKVDGTAMAYS